MAEGTVRVALPAAVNVRRGRSGTWRDGLGFGARFGLGMLLIGALGWLDLDRPASDVVARWQARAAYALLHTVEPRAGISGVTISVPQGLLEVTEECTGVTIAAMLGAAVLAYPTTWRRRLTGLALLVPLIFTLDVVRVASLGVSLAYGREVFDVLHQVVWQGVMVLVLLGYWLAWTMR